MGLFSRKDKKENTQEIKNETLGAPKPPMAPGTTPPPAMGAPKPPMAPGMTPPPAMGAPKPPMAPGMTPPPAMGAPKPPMAPGMTPPPAMGAPKSPFSTTTTTTTTTTYTSNNNMPSFGPTPSSNFGNNSFNNIPSSSGFDFNNNSMMSPTSGFESPVADILEMDIMSGRIPKMEITPNTNVEVIKDYINRLTTRKEQLIVYETRLKARKEEIEGIIGSKKARLPSSKSTSLKVVNSKKKKNQLKVVKAKVNNVDEDENKKNELKVVKKSSKKSSKSLTTKKVSKPITTKETNKIDENQKHTVVSMKDFNSYNLEQRRKDWHKKAGHNAKQVVCNFCKDDDNWETIKLEDGKHICYYCWIKKPETLKNLSNKPVVIKKETKKEENLKLQKHKSSPINKNLGKVKPNKKRTKLVTNKK